MQLLYNIGVRFYYLAVLFTSLWNTKASNWISGRKKWRNYLAGIFTAEDRVIWFHCASLGEFEQGRPLIERVRERYPGYKILLTFFSPSGYNKRKDYKHADHVCYLPLDTMKNAMDFLEMVPVEKVFFIKYEFWYHFLKQIHQRGIDLYLASGNFQKSHIFFRWYGRWYRGVFYYFTHIFVQDERSEALLRSFGLENVSEAGDTRFDRVTSIPGNGGEKTGKQLFKSDTPVIIAGSTWEKDEALIREAYYSLKSRCNWIIAPHEISRQNIDRLKSWFPDHNLLSEILNGNNCETDSIIVDTIGHLSSLYKYGSIAYIGGGFGKGIHNILEASAAGIPILFGPNFQRFREAMDLKSEGVAYVVEQSADITSRIQHYLDNPELLKTDGQIAENYTFKNTGATTRIVNFVFKSSP